MHLIKNTFKTKIQCPLRYYGGKQMLSAFLLQLMPAHRCYCEPFFGGGALFFAKPKSKCEAINDTNAELINFYRILQTHPEKLHNLLSGTLYSQQDFQKAIRIYFEKESSDPVARAWALFMLLRVGHRGHIKKVFGHSKQLNQPVHFHKAKARMAYFAQRLEHTEIWHTDALEMLRKKDAPLTFFFVDPPYFNSDMGHYGGYTEKDFIRLLEALQKLKGKFLLTAYPSPILTEYTQTHHWHSLRTQSFVYATEGKKKHKTEILTMNYTPLIQPDLFDSKPVILKD